MYGREKRASILLAFFFLLFGIFIILESITELISQHVPRTLGELVALSVTSLSLMIPFGIFKYMLASKLDSIALQKDVFCCFCGKRILIP